MFHHFWMLVDGIYPSLARFVNPISVPLGKMEALFSMWQEAKWKDVEHFFGVFKQKFHFFNRPIPLPFIEDIIDTFYCCIILHNMAVSERMASEEDEVESYEIYDCIEWPVDHGTMQDSHVDSLALQFVEREEANVRSRNLEVQYLAALGINIVDCTLQADTEWMEVLPQLERMVQLRWNHLYDVRHHKKTHCGDYEGTQRAT